MNSITIRNIPSDLLERLRQKAKKERRSLNSEILHILEKSEEEKNPEDLFEIIDELNKDVDFVKNVESAYKNRSYDRPNKLDL